MSSPKLQTTQIPGTIEAEITTGLATVQIIRLDWRDDIELSIKPLDHFQIDLCLSARLQGMSVCYPDTWGSLRYEPVGELTMIPPGQAVLAHCDFPEGANTYTHASTVVKLRPELVWQWSGEEPWSSDHLQAALDITDQSIYSLMGRLAREAQSVLHAPATDMNLTLVELIARQLGIEISRYFTERPAELFKGGLAAWRLRRIDARAQEVGKAPTLEELASLCNISLRQLQRGFRVSRGCTLGHYLESCRIENAKRLLQQGQAVQAVAQALGYASPSGFSSAFRRITGVTPQQFRQRV